MRRIDKALGGACRMVLNREKDCPDPKPLYTDNVIVDGNSGQFFIDAPDELKSILCDQYANV